MSKVKTKHMTMVEFVAYLSYQWKVYNARAIDGQLQFDGLEQTRYMEDLMRELERRVK